MSGTEFRRLLLPLLSLAALLVVLPPLLLAGLSRATGVEIATQAQVKQATVLATDLADDLQRALATGLPPDGIPGVAERFGGLLQRYPRILFLALLDRDGTLLSTAGLPPERLLPIVQASRARIAPGLRAARGVPMPVTMTVGDLSVTRFFLGSHDRPAGELVYALRYSTPAGLLSGQTATLAAMMAVLLLLGLPALHAVLRHEVRLPADRLRRAFDGAAGGSFGFVAGMQDLSELGRLARLWNNEVLSLEERRNQLAAFAAEARQAADDPAVAREIERLARAAETAGGGVAAFATAPAAACDEETARLRLPLTILAFVAAACLGNTPQQPLFLLAAAALLAGGAAGAAAVHRSGILPRAAAAIGIGATAAALLAGALRPAILPPGLLDAGLVAVPALFAGLLGAAALSASRLHAPRRERAVLLLHLAAGLAAAAIWSIPGLAIPDDTLEAWAGLAMLAVAAAILWRRTP